jgi:hypothetical protein
VEDLRPRAKVEAAVGDGNHDFTSHDLPLHVGIGVIFAGAIVEVLARWAVRGELLQPVVMVPVEPRSTS